MVRIFDVPGAYLHAFYPNEKFVLMEIEGQFVDVMYQADPPYTNEIQYKNGKKWYMSNRPRPSMDV